MKGRGEGDGTRAWGKMLPGSWQGGVKGAVLEEPLGEGPTREEGAAVEEEWEKGEVEEAKGEGTEAASLGLSWEPGAGAES